jgi:hypothetical protein
MTQTAPPPLQRSLSRTKEGSRSRKIVGLIWRLSQELGRGVEIAEIREAYPGKPPATLTAEVHSLKRRGVIQTLGGRASHMRFGLPGSGLPGGSEEDEGEQVLAALKAAWARERRPISTREVAAELRERGSSIPDSHPNATRKRLETLAAERERGHLSRRAPQVRRIAKELSAAYEASLWIPARVRWTREELPARSSADWSRTAVDEATAALGLPVDGMTLTWWADALPDGHPLRRTRPDSGVRGALSKAMRQDRRHEEGPRRLQPLQTQSTCYGGAPLRASLGPPEKAAGPVCSVLDAITMLRLADELGGLRDLGNRAEHLNCRVLREMYGRRRDVLAWAIHEAVGDADVREITRALKRYIRVKARWLEAGIISDGQRDARTRELRALKRDLSALPEALELPVPAEHPGFRVGQTSFFNLDQLDGPIESTRELAGIEEGDRRYLVGAARRFPPYDAGEKRKIGSPREVPLALVDRVDAIRELVSHLALARTAVLVEEAVFLIGHVFRDFPALLVLLDEDDMPFQVRQAVVVALGMLEFPLPFERVVIDPCDFQEVSAWVLSITLADWNGAEAHIREALSLTAGPARDVVSTALMRLDMGGALSVLG